MKLNYKEKRILSMEEKSEQEVSYMVNATNLQLQSQILETRRLLEVNKCTLQEAKQTYPLDPERVIELELEVEALTDGIERLEKLSEELGFV